MSLAFVPQQQKIDMDNNVSTVQKLLDENGRLIEVIKEYQNLGRYDDAFKHQQLLHRNLVYLAKLGDQSLLMQLTTDTETHRPSSGGIPNDSTSTPPPHQAPSLQFAPSIHTPQGLSPQQTGPPQMLSPQSMPCAPPHLMSPHNAAPGSGFAPSPQQGANSSLPPNQHPGAGQMQPGHMQHAKQMPGGMMGQNGLPPGMGGYQSGYEQQLAYQQQMMQQQRQQQLHQQGQQQQHNNTNFMR